MIIYDGEEILYIEDTTSFYVAYLLKKKRSRFEMKKHWKIEEGGRNIQTSE
jgi:hypothetical protein